MDIDQIERLKPMEIEQRSFEIISQEAGDAIPDDERAMIIKRVIHTSADFDYIQKPLLFRKCGTDRTEGTEKRRMDRDGYENGALRYQ